MYPDINEAIEILKKGYGFVIITFSDSSKEIICTTLNKELLKQENVPFVQDHFYDCLKKKYIKFRENATDIEVYDDVPQLEEVYIFANQFI